MRGNIRDINLRGNLALFVAFWGLRIFIVTCELITRGRLILNEFLQILFCYVSPEPFVEGRERRKDIIMNFSHSVAQPTNFCEHKRVKRIIIQSKENGREIYKKDHFKTQPEVQKNAHDTYM